MIDVSIELNFVGKQIEIELILKSPLINGQQTLLSLKSKLQPGRSFCLVLRFASALSVS